MPVEFFKTNWNGKKGLKNIFMESSTCIFFDSRDIKNYI